MTQIALDSSTVLTWLLQERRWQAVDALLKKPDIEFVLPGPALTEIIWIARKKGNVSAGAAIATALRAYGMRVEPANEGDLLRAAEILEISKKNPGPVAPKTNLPATLSLGDAIILAVTDRLGCQIVTRDSYWNWLITKGLLDIKVQPL